MKRLSLLVLPFLAIIVLFAGCLRDECTSVRTYIQFEPVYKPVSEIRIDPKVESPQALKAPGKIYYYDHYLFINELKEGVHVFDNTDPEKPREIAFWRIPGNVDMVIRDGYMYADEYMDLITVDISNINQPKMVCRNPNVFQLYGVNSGNEVLIDYKQTEIKEKVNCNDARWSEPWYMEGDVVYAFDGFFKNNTGGATGLPASIGLGGSFARFGFSGDFLYTIDNFLLKSWTLANAGCPVKTDSAWLGWNAETIFPWKDRLFIGSQTGVFIFNNTNPAHPVLESTFNHASGCDPVVCDEKNAYVTIHSGTTCNGTLNQLDIIDIQNLPNASLVKSYPMTEPRGLSLSGNLMVLCDDGLKIFDRSDPLNLKELSHTRNIDAHDVISLTDTQLLLIGDQGFYQIDMSDPEHPRQLSLIPVEK